MMQPDIVPLADRMRPKSVNQIVGQTALLGPGRPLRLVIDNGRLHSMILWGPPGSGKTTLARLLAQAANAQIIGLSAVTAGVKELRQAVQAAEEHRRRHQATVLFLDEIHRFNKSQQDALLPHVESGLLTLIGATTENPSFELRSALLSRCRVYRLEPLGEEALLSLIERALTAQTDGLGQTGLDLTDSQRMRLARVADGDARRVLNLLEQLSVVGGKLDDATFDAIVAQGPRLFDKQGDWFYDLISALHKSVRGSAPDAALYWLARMLDGGVDPLYIARRLVRMASEDIGNADPRAITIALSAWDVQERLGSPEGELTLAQAVLYLATTPKSNAVYLAFSTAKEDVRRNGSLPVPLHLRNAPTPLMREMGHGHRYRYAHDEPEAYAAGERYFPEQMEERQYYRPVDRGWEVRIRERLVHWRALDRLALDKESKR